MCIAVPLLVIVARERERGECKRTVGGRGEDSTEKRVG